MILAHRGDTQNYSPNTRESVLSALGKCDGVELDLNISSDGTFFFYHEGDWTAERLARRYMFADLSRFVPNQHSVLGLREALQLVKQANKHLLIHAEIGGGGSIWALDFDTGEVQDILRIIEESGIGKDLVLFHTINYGKAKELDGHTVFHRLPILPPRDYGMYRFGSLMGLLSHLNASRSMAYVINDKREFQKLMDWGIGYILTDRLI